MKQRTWFQPALVVMLFSVCALCHELCKDLASPKTGTNTFCTQYSGDTCCSSSKETTLSSDLTNLAIADATCKGYFKQILCAQCDPWGAHLFEAETSGTPNSLASGNLPLPNLCSSYCTSFYSACANINIPNIGGSGVDTIAAAYADSTTFCNTFAPSTASVCYDGTKYSPPAIVPSLPSSPVICVEKFRGGFGGVYIVNLLDPNDGSNRLFVALKNGSIFIISKTTGATQAELLRKSQALGGSETGLLGFALHPNFAAGTKKFYIYWSCSSASCPVSCSGSTCDASKLTCTSNVCTGGDHTSVISEYTISTTDSNTANTSSERRILLIAQPYPNHNSGLLLFGPTDKKLYIFLGDGGSGNDPQNRAQDLTTLLGKVLRIDIDSKDTGLQYSIPTDNPFYGASDGSRQEIWTYGMRNPWRGSFDADNAAYLFVGDVGQSGWEEVDLLTKGGFYGWPIYEGNHVNTAKSGLSVSALHIPPITEDARATIGGGPAVVGGYVYRGLADTCLQGKYVYGDYQGSYFAIANESPPLSGQFEKVRAQLRCATDQTACGVTGTSAVGTMASFGEDAQKDLYILASSNILRVVSRDRCGLSTSDCSDVGSLSSTTSPSSGGGGGGGGNPLPTTSTTLPSTTTTTQPQQQQSTTTSPAGTSPSSTSATTPSSNQQATTPPATKSSVSSTTICITSVFVLCIFAILC